MLHAVNSFSPAVYCTDDNDTIRIFGSNPEKGMLQVCKDGIWHAVCDSRWRTVMMLKLLVVSLDLQRAELVSLAHIISYVHIST